MADFQAKALYDYETEDSRLLSFCENDLFMILTSLSKDPNWYYAITPTGQAGFVPVTYMQKTELAGNREAFLRFVEKIYDCLKEPSGVTETSCAALYALRKQALKRLKNLRDCLRNGNSTEEQGSLIEHQPSSAEERLSAIVKDNATALSSGRSSPGNFLVDYLPQLNTEWISDLMGDISDKSLQLDLKSAATNDMMSCMAADMVEQIRSQTQLSHNLSRTAVCVVLRCISKHLGPSGSCDWQQLCDAVLNSQCAVTPTSDVSHVPTSVLSRDGERLRSIFTTLWDAKNDSQQRSWPIHEDETTITGLLEELYTILVDADPRVCVQAIQSNDYDYVTTLALYYQMEPRTTIRVWMLRVFLTICELDFKVVELLLHSVLPMELARDLQTNNDEYIGESFITFILDQIESPEVEEEVLELLVGALLAINLHKNSDFVLISEKAESDNCSNIVMQVLRKRHDARALTQKLMLLINREDDPARVLRHPTDQPNSVLKLLVELFSDPTTADLFYLNDVIVLIEIVARQLSDLSLGDKRRVMYVQLISNIVENVNAYEGQRSSELRRCFHASLTNEEAPQSEVLAVQAIIRKHPKWFGPDTTAC